jgi:hypothetical protein
MTNIDGIPKENERQGLGTVAVLSALALAAMVDAVPILSIPTRAIHTFLHESAHGLAALLTGGKVLALVVHGDGSGSLTSAGGSRFLITFAGYAGAAIAGAALAISARTSPKTRKLIATLFLVWIASSLVLWTRDAVTAALLATAALPPFLALKARSDGIGAWLLLVIGAGAAIDAIKAPLALLGMKAFVGGLPAISDAAALADLTLVPEIIWFAIWEAIAIPCLWKSIKPTFGRK